MVFTGAVIRRTAALSITAALIGCVNGLITPSVLINKTTENTELVFFGVPLLLAVAGSSVRLDEDWMITAAHNSHILEAVGTKVYAHPDCDVALYRKEGTNVVPLGSVSLNDKVTHLGYYLGAMLSDSSGDFVATVTKLEFPHCKADVITTASAGQGMSGGGVYNSKGELVGVTDAIYHETMSIQGNNKYSEVSSPTSFVSISDITPWLKEVTGKDYF